ncbi:MAG: DUF2924 domain-containing protein [Paracoccaceae bacterium]
MTPTVAAIESMDRTALLAAWSGIFGTPPPKSLSQPFLRRFLAFEVQARRARGLSQGFIAELTAKGGKPQSPRLKPGGRFLREWNGVTHVVEVTDAGFDWNGSSYRSLSAIAQSITGAHWSGPRFFGLKEQVR